MTESIQRFIETNFSLIDTNMNEFLMTAYNGLTIRQQGELISVLDEAGIDYELARETSLRFIVTMTVEILERPVYLDTFVSRHLEGILGCTHQYLCDFMLEEASEFDVEIVSTDHRGYMIVPKQIEV